MTDDDLRTLFVAHSAEIRRHFDVAVERMEKRFDLLSEALTQVDQKLDGTEANLRNRMQRGLSEIQAMIGF